MDHRVITWTELQEAVSRRWRTLHHRHFNGRGDSYGEHRREDGHVYSAGSRELLKKITTAAGPSGILIAPDNKRAFIACSGAGVVQVLDLDSLTITGLVATGNQPDGMAYATK